MKNLRKSAEKNLPWLILTTGAVASLSSILGGFGEFISGAMWLVTTLLGVWASLSNAYRAKLTEDMVLNAIKDIAKNRPQLNVSAGITGQSQLATMSYEEFKVWLERDYPFLTRSKV